MKTHIKKLFLLPALIAGLGLLLAGQVEAQTFKTLHSFTNSPDGANPYAGLILSGNTLYGTAEEGGTNGSGTVFAINTDGTGFTNLYSFTALDNNFDNNDGANPEAGLILSGNTLYGTAAGGGIAGLGAVFAINTRGTGFTNLYSFRFSDGNYPLAGLILSDNTLYGTAEYGGIWGYGTVFALNTNGMGFTNLYSFTQALYPNYANGDGAVPQAGLILSGNNLYGTATEGGISGSGTVFAISTNGSVFNNLYSFTATSHYPSYTNSDGAFPEAGLILSGNTLYGTAYKGGSLGYGTVFAVNINSMIFTNLYTFTNGSDGAYPEAGLILSGNTLYGTAYKGGSSGNGTVFTLNTNGIGFMNLYSFTATDPDTTTNSDGANPKAGLILSGNTLYGTAEYGGSSGNGTVFSLSLVSVSTPPPRLTIIPSGANVILTWPTNATGFTLEFATNLVSPVWNTNLPPPVILSGFNTVTNPISSTHQFFRLSNP